EESAQNLAPEIQEFDRTPAADQEMPNDSRISRICAAWRAGCMARMARHSCALIFPPMGCSISTARRSLRQFETNAMELARCSRNFSTASANVAYRPVGRTGSGPTRFVGG